MTPFTYQSSWHLLCLPVQFIYMLTINTNESHMTNSLVEHLFGLKKLCFFHLLTKLIDGHGTVAPDGDDRTSRSHLQPNGTVKTESTLEEEGKSHGNPERQLWDSASTPAALQNSPQPEDYICKASRLTPHRG